MGRLMATLPKKLSSPTRLFRVFALTLGLTLLANTGCAERRYLARSLPTDYTAPVRENVEEIDLSGLTNYSAGSEMIDRGDVLEVTVVTDYGDRNAMTVPARVDDNGLADVPLIGKVPVAGFELDEAEQAITSAGVARGMFQKPHVTVTMKRQRKNAIMVIGAVKEPGLKELPRGSCSLLAALVSAGGLSEDAGTDVEIRPSLRSNAAPGPPDLNAPRVAGGDGTALTGYETATPVSDAARAIVRVNLTKTAAEGKAAHVLSDGDVVYVMKEVPKPVYVMGLVRKPGEVELSPNKDMYMLDALALAGERTLPVADKVIVIRRIAGEEKPIVIEASVREAKANGAANVRLMAGDIVSVEETPATIVMRTLTDVLRIGVGSTIPMF